MCWKIYQHLGLNEFRENEKNMSKEKKMRKYIIMTVILFSSVWLFATADDIRTGILSNMAEFSPSRTYSTHGNLYGMDDTTIIRASYNMPTSLLSTEPEHIQVTYYTKITFAFADYPLDNKIVVNWGDASGSTTTVYSPVTHVAHQYDMQDDTYIVTIKTYRLSGNTYAIEPDHEIKYEIGFFPYDGVEEVATEGGQTVGNLTLYRSETAERIRRPVLIVEGFDLHSNNTVSNIIGLNPELYRQLLFMGYDLYILTFADSNNSLYVNAGLVLSALERIRAHYSEGGDFAGYGCAPIKVVGYSMGGVLARIALASAEDENGFAHGSNLLLTVDSPHRGFVVNQDLQEEIQDLINLIPDNIDLFPSSSDILSELTELTNTPVARQLMRNNIHAENGNIMNGSNEYRNVFDFLNPCEAPNVDHINQDTEGYNSSSYNPQLDYKSGFPWKQNQIKKYAVTFGKRGAIGNIGNENSFANMQVTWKIFGFPGGFTWDLIDSAWHDKCPGSYFPTEFHYQQKIIPDSFGNSALEQVIGWIIGADDFKMKFNVNYDLPVIPVISSLCITNRSFSGSNEPSLPDYSQAIADPVQTPFDQYYIPTESSPHQVLSPMSAWWIKSRFWEFRYHMENDKIGQISGTMRLGTQLLANQPFVITNQNTRVAVNVSTNEAGLLQFDNYFINNCTYEIKHAGGMYYPQLVTVNVNMFGSADMGFVNFTAPVNVVYVDRSPTSNACHTIQNAFEVCKGLGISHIILTGDTYPESVNVWDIGFDTQNFVLEGNGTVIIHSPTWNRALTINQTINRNIDELTIRNIIFEDSDEQGGNGVALTSYMPGYIKHVTMENCTIRNCGDNASPSPDDPVGLYSNIPIHINNCDFYNNQGGYGNSYSGSRGAIYLKIDPETIPSIIENCSIHDNYARNASAITVSGSGSFVIRNNDIYNNHQTYEYENYCVEGKDAKIVDISNNLIYNNFDNSSSAVGRAEYAIGLLRTSSNNSTSNVTVKNNTLAGHRRALLVRNVNTDVKNNLIDVWNTGVYFAPGYNQSMLRYSYNFMKTYTNTQISENYDINVPSNPGNLFGDPQVDANYVPIWNSTTMSPCIDAGSGYKDADGTPADIGARKAINHAYWAYRFRDGLAEDPQLPNPKDTWQWVSYPVVNTLTQGKKVARTFFSELLGKHYVFENSEWVSYPDVLQEIQWLDGGTFGNISFESSDWGNLVDHHSVASPQGYKIKMLPGEPNQTVLPTVTLHHSGFRTPATTPFDIVGSPNPQQLVIENWIGYFDKDSAMPNTAFASIWNDIIFVRGKNWNLYRDETGNLVGTMGALNDGDMVIIATYNHHQSFRWENTVPIPPHKKSVAEAFEYNELPDYKPVYIDLSGINTTDMKEIGLYLNDVCKGAVVVEDSLEMICAYLEDGESLDAGDVYESKSAPQCVQSIKVKDADLIKAYPSNLTDYPVYNLKVKSPDASDLTPPPLALEHNYPNPFNPETTIRYSIDEPGMVALDIYNLKGQLVKTLSNGNANSGRYSVIWNGTDNSGNACSSGVYFYRLSTKNKTLVQKMLMLK
ncbi:MAG: hypothetical protein CVU50_05825 [Candidatus Cloacimonetes bacterium HGW-Cloacimonetes-3]|nr:MAG: hypothetical protein CVU50_05825 [Candidatus Cloacimonetes bacterium HGW-Cloacimonetes-3]